MAALLWFAAGAATVIVLEVVAVRILLRMWLYAWVNGPRKGGLPRRGDGAYAPPASPEHAGETP